jgi:4-amino-4-deoxy-L-arabinose transferase-like glycosyltransferase
MTDRTIAPYSLAKLLHLLFAGAMAYAVFCVFALNIDTSDYRDETLPMIAGTVGAAIVLGLTWILRQWIVTVALAITDRLDRIPTRTVVFAAIALGVALRLATVVVFPPYQTSDGASYYSLALKLAAGEDYAVAGTRAYWPPGLPLALTPWILVFGDRWWIPTAHNLVLFLVLVPAAASFARRMGSETAAKVCVIAIAIWPNLFIDAGMASKESQTLTLLTISLALYPAIAFPRRLRATLGSGVALGAATLTQPALMLSPLAFIAFEIVRRSRPLDGTARILVLLAGFAAAISPWTIRNYTVFGEFVPITSTSGFALYIGNNDLAWGGWVDFKGRNDPTLDQSKDELGASRRALQKALTWMRENPDRAAFLILRKNQLFLGDDSDSVFAALKRGLKIEGPVYVAVKMTAIAFWMSIVIGLLLFMLTAWRRSNCRLPLLACLPILMFFYLFSLHSFVESGSRHHIALYAALAAMLGGWISIAGASRHAPSATAGTIDERGHREA